MALIIFRGCTHKWQTSRSNLLPMKRRSMRSRLVVADRMGEGFPEMLVRPSEIAVAPHGRKHSWSRIRGSEFLICRSCAEVRTVAKRGARGPEKGELKQRR